MFGNDVKQFSLVEDIACLELTKDSELFLSIYGICFFFIIFSKELIFSKKIELKHSLTLVHKDLSEKDIILYMEEIPHPNTYEVLVFTFKVAQWCLIHKNGKVQAAKKELECETTICKDYLFMF